MKIGTITSTLKRSLVGSPHAAGGLLLRDRNVRLAVDSDPHRHPTQVPPLPITSPFLSWSWYPGFKCLFFFLKESPDRSVQSWTALIRTSTGAWNYICTGSSGSVSDFLLVHWTARCIGVVLHQHHKRLFGLFHLQFALKCLMWTVMGFCLEMSFMKWWWPCWRCGRTIGQTYSL